MIKKHKIPPVFTRKDIEGTVNKYDTWLWLRTLKKAYEEQYTGYYEPTVKGYSDSFDKWLVNVCGIGIYFDNEGNIKGNIDILDEAKYAWALLKYK